jgi:hypothetical protein
MYRELPAIEVQVLEAVFVRRQKEFAPIDLPGVWPELAAVTVCRLLNKGFIHATPDGVPGYVTALGLAWLRVHGLA